MLPSLLNFWDILHNGSFTVKRSATPQNDGDKAESEIPIGHVTSPRSCFSLSSHATSICTGAVGLEASNKHATTPSSKAFDQFQVFKYLTLFESILVQF